MYIILYITLIKNNNNIEIEYRLSNIIKKISFTQKENFLEELIEGINIDSINIGMVILTGIITPIIYIIKMNKREKNIISIIQIIILILLLTNNIILFYINYEIILIPLFIYLIAYGSKYMKEEGGYRLYMYTIMGSLLLLISIIIIYIIYNSFNGEYITLNKNNNNIKIKKIIWLMMIFSFIIKYPIYPFHIWLPYVHVESPTIGSVILAALILKLAYYGIIRFIIPLFNNNIHYYYTPLIYLLSILSILYISIINIREIDMKRIIAYSSIIHMNMAIFGLFSKEISSIVSSKIIMLSHGFISSLLFLLIGILYIRYHSRIIYYYKGLFLTMPIFSIIVLITILANVSIPFTSSFIPELLIIFNILNENIFLSILFLFSIFFSSIYSFWLLIRILFGSLSPYISSYLDLTFYEFLILVPFLLFIFISSFFFPLISNLFFPSFLLLL